MLGQTTELSNELRKELDDLSDDIGVLLEYLKNEEEEELVNYFLGTILNPNIEKKIVDYFFNNFLIKIKKKNLKGDLSLDIALTYQSYDLDYAHKYLKKSLEYYQENASENELNLATIYYYLKDYEKAVEYFNNIQSLSLNSVFLYSDCYLKQFKYDEALSLLNKALNDNIGCSDEKLIYQTIARVYLMKNEFDLANDYFKKGDIINDYHLLLEVGEYYENIGELRTSLNYYQHIYELGETLISFKIKRIEQQLIVDERVKITS